MGSIKGNIQIVKLIMLIIAFNLTYSGIKAQQLYPANFDLGTLNGTNGFRIPGILNGSLTGSEVDFIGDINNDGFDDIAIGAQYASFNGFTRAGTVYVVFGSSTGFGADFDILSLNGTNGFIIEGIENEERIGSSISGIGDVNGDGIDDFITAGDIDALVIYGSSSTFVASIDKNDLNGSNGFIIESNRFNEVAGLGDVNGDGISDFIVGPVFTSTDTLVIFGRTSNFPGSFDQSWIDGSNGFRIDGYSSTLRASYLVGSAGDVNNDGFNDIILGDWSIGSGSFQERTHVLFGRSSFDPIVDVDGTLDGSNGFTIQHTGGSFLAYVGLLGDINNDNIDDIFSEGLAIYGSSDAFPANFDVSDINGSNGFNLPAISVAASIGDINRDGIDDFVSTFGSNGSNPIAYVVFGSSTGFPDPIDETTLNGNNGFIIEGLSGGSGRPVDGGGDFNGDGISDFILGNRRATNGEAYVVFGGDHYAIPLNTGYPQAIDETLSGFTLVVNGPETGTIHYAIYPGNFSGTPDHDDILNGTGATTNDNFLMDLANTDIEEIISSLMSDTVYDVYLFLEDGVGNQGEIYHIDNVRTLSPTPSVNLSVSSDTGTEAAGTVITVTATSSTAVVGDQTIDLAASGIGITATDFTLSGTTITITDGMTTGTVTFTIVDDAVVEGTETATLTISNPSTGIVLGTTIEQDVVITDNDSAPLPTVNLSVSSNTGTEAAGTVITVTATSTTAVMGDQTIDLAASGIGITASDFILSGTTITILDGMTTGTVTFTIVDDTDVEGTETARLTISNPSTGIVLGITTEQDVVITDNDSAPIPTVNLSVSSNTGTEATGTVITVTATSSAAVVGDQTIDLAASGIGITSSDFTLSTTTITILDGMTTGTATFTILDDTDIEGTETARLTISNPSTGIVLGTTTEQDVVITDNDSAPLPTVNLSVSSNTGTEAAGTVITVTATSSAAVVGDQTIDLATTGTGITASDFILSGTTITIADGTTTGTVTFTIEDDTDIEGTETATLTISNPSSGITLGGTTTQDVDITDNDFAPLPTVSLSVSSDTGTEAAGTVITVTATSSTAVMGDQTIDLAASGIGITASDFILSGTTITIADGTTTGTATFTIVDDTDIEGTETATLTISNPSSGITLGGTTTQDVDITDNDFAPLPTVNLSVSANVGTEAAGTVITVTATSTTAVMGDQTIDLATTGTGITASDFTLSGTTITIADGMTTGTVTFTIEDDTDIEGTETATLTISNPSSGITLGGTTTQDVDITDNDFAPLPTVNLSVSSNTGTEAAGTVITVTATSSAAVVGDQTIDLATTGTGITASDFTLSGTTITIADGMTTGTVTFTIEDDTDIEGTETATLTISNPSSGITLGGTTTQDVDITDNDFAPLPTVNLSVSSNTGTEAAGTVITVTATSSAAVVGDQTIDLATTGTGITASDFILSGTTITIADGTTTGTVTFTIEDDTDIEGTETARLTISNPSTGIVLGTTIEQDVVITDNDSAPIPTVNLSVSANVGTEAAGTVITVTATSSTAVVGNQTVDLVTKGVGITSSDFILSTTTITILDGMTTGTATFTIVDDTDVEGTEMVRLAIRNPSTGIVLGTTTEQDVVIEDNDFVECDIEAGEDQEIVQGQEIQLDAVVSNPGTLTWLPSEGLNNSSIANPIASPTETTTYTLFFTGNDGCTAEDMVTVYVTPLEEDETGYGFSPDGDGINEYWEIHGIDNYPNNRVLIYNRWGDLVFETEGYNNTSRVFRGIANRKRSIGGGKLPEGTYFFDIKIEGIHNLKKETGFLVLKR